MATTAKSGKSRPSDQEVCKDTIEQALEIQKDSGLASVGHWLPVGLIVTSTTPISQSKNIQIKAINLGWEEEVNDNQAMIRKVKFVNEFHHMYDRNMYLELELFPWDRIPFKSSESGVTHVLRNFMGNAVIRQTVVSEKSAEDMLNKLLTYAAEFVVQHCKIPQTIKLHK